MKFWLQCRSVKSKFIGLTVLFFSAGFCLSLAIFAFVGERKARDNFVQELRRTIAFIVDHNQWQKQVNEGEHALLSSTQSQQFFTSDLIVQICLYDANRQLLTSFNREGRQCDSLANPIAGEEVSFTQQSVRLIRPVSEEGKTKAFAAIEAHYSDVSLLKRQFVWLFFFAFTTCLLLAYFISRKIVHRSLLPLNELYNTSKVIARNPLSATRAVKISNDEFGRVIDVFNTMLDNFSRENSALVTSENRFRSLSENAPIGVYLKSNNDFEYTNHRWSQITGLATSTLSQFASNIDPNDKKYYDDALLYARRNKSAQVIEYRYFNPDLGRRTLMEYISLIEDEHGRECYIGSLMDVTELKVAQIELEKLAFYDPLTLLPNRRFFKDHLELAIARAHKEKKKIAIYMTDLDDFKRVNDVLGHDAGDKLLVNIATRLKKVLFEGDVVSRLGGDEFMLLLDNIDDPTRLDHASQRIVDALRMTVQSGNESLQVAGSVGIAIYPTDADTPEELLRYADIALYNAKGAGGNRISYYSCELDRRIKEKVSLEHKLRKALAENTLEVYLQPQYCTHSHAMKWAEALVRWPDKELGFISPEVFIPLAEETGLIFPLSDFVLERVLQLLSGQSSKLKSLGIEGVAVNLSPKQFFAPGFVQNIEERLKYYQVPATALEFEITETTVMDDMEKAVALMQQLRDRGFKLAIDDFGTGFSSLSSLKNFPINSLKIDKSFIQDIPGDQSDVEISCAIIAMAKKLGLSVVAEGVETLVQAEFLAANHCEYLQGFYFAKPMPIDELLQKKVDLSVS